MKKIEIKVVNSEDEFKLFWYMHSEYMDRDVFPNDEMDLEIAEERKWFSSLEYKKNMHELFSRDIDRAYPRFFIREEELIGFCSYCSYLSEDGKCFIIDYCIIPELRNRGLGRYIFNKIKEIEISRGAKYFELNISNENNMRFWMKQGFYIDGFDEYGVMKLTTKKSGS